MLQLICLNNCLPYAVGPLEAGQHWSVVRVLEEKEAIEEIIVTSTPLLMAVPSGEVLQLRHAPILSTVLVAVRSAGAYPCCPLPPSNSLGCL